MFMNNLAHRATFFFCLGSALFFSSTALKAEFLPPSESPYNFGPEGRSIEDARDYGKPNEMVAILPGRMVKSHDKYGNTTYFGMDGKVALKVNIDGSTEYTYQGKTIQQNPDGKVIGTIERLKGTDKVEIRNDKGQLVGWQLLKYGGKTVEEYDYEGNKVKTTQYNKYGKAAEYVLDETIQSKTIFNPNGTPRADVNFEGGEVAWYLYDQNGKVTEKTDYKGNKTHFDQHGSMTFSEDRWGNKLVTYNYKTDTEGRYFLDTSVNYLGNITYFKHGKPQVEKTASGEVLKNYQYDGETLVYTYDTKLKETTWFSMLGKPLLTERDDDVLIRKWYYNKGILLGEWETNTNTLIAYIHGQEVARYKVQEEPTTEQLQYLIDTGYIKKQYGK